MLKLEVLVEVDGRETVCAMELPETTTVGEANEAVRERCGTGDGTWSLYSHDLGRFLHRKLSLLSQQVTGGGSLEYKAATQVARVHMWDGSVTSVLLDLTRGASDVVCILCDKMGVAATGRHEYALRLQEPNGVRRRLRPDEALLEQGVDQFRELAFGKAFSTPQELDDLESAFGLCCEGFLEGNWPTGEAEVLALAALLVQVQHGDYARFKVDLDTCLPIQWRIPRNATDALAFLLCWKCCQAESNVELGSLPRDIASMIARCVFRGDCEVLEKSVFDAWKPLVGVECKTGMHCFVEKCRELRSYGLVSYPCQNGLRVGVSRDTIWELNPQGGRNAVQREWPLTSLRRWAVDREAKGITLDVEGNGHYEQFETVHGGDIATLIGGYIDVILRTRS